MTRRIQFKDMCNFRSLGGYHTSDGKVTAANKFYRSSMMYYDSTDEALFKSLQIDTIIDLRSPKEVELEPNEYRQLVPHYIVVNLSKAHYRGRSEQLARQTNDPYFMRYRYLEYLSNLDAVRDIVRAILKAQGPIVFHCSAGKDRTGAIAFILLKVAKVPLKTIVEDYTRSYDYIKNDKRIMDPTKNLNVYISYPEVIEMMDPLFIEKYHSVEEYLLQCGLSETEIKELHDKLVNPT